MCLLFLFNLPGSPLVVADLSGLVQILSSFQARTRSARLWSPSNLGMEKLLAGLWIIQVIRQSV